MSNKYLHVSPEGIVKAVTLAGERVPPYGVVHEVAITAPYGVGDAYVPPTEAEPVPAPVASKKGKAA